MKRRSKIRTAVFAISLFTVMLAWGITATVKMHRSETQVRISQQRALTQLCEYMDNIETSLTKSLYTESDNMLSVLSSDLYKQATGAKTSLSTLSSGDTELTHIYKFLSQVGEYTATLNKKAAAGEKITPKERDTLRKLLEYATSLSSQLDQMSALLNGNYLSFDKIDDSLMQADKNSEKEISFINSISDAEESMTNFPTLIYDGPFSDNILTKDSVMLKNSDKISVEAAKKKAADYLGVDEDTVIYDGETAGRIATYIFHYDKSSAAVTQHGGYLAYILSEDNVGVEKINADEAVEKAVSYLESIGYKDMESSYYSVHDGICTANFAAKQGAFICYPDLIKVSVALDNGRIVSVDATDYIMNHISRDIPETKISTSQAVQVASPLTVQKCGFAVIPTESGGEASTYELYCTADDGQDVLVYKDIVSGKEDDILILLYSDNGTLTK